MLTTSCPNCGNAVFVFAGSCARCGAANGMRLGAVAVVGSFLFLIVAVGIAVFAAVRWQWELTGPADDVAWLTAAMEECDAAAAKTPDTLHFLVIPMASRPADDAQWRTSSLNDIGNAVLLAQRVMLEGLKSGALRISTEQYEFRARDEATGVIFNWSPSAGVKKFLVPNAARIVEFKAQIKTQQKTSDAAWGATFVHRKGTCYWVNAIIGN
jgi:hypothetical protein